MKLRSSTAAEKENDPPAPNSSTHEEGAVSPPPIESPAPPVATPSPPAALQPNASSVPPTQQESSPPNVATLDSMVADIRDCKDTAAVSYAKTTTNNSPSYTEKRKKIIDQFIAGLAMQAPKYDKYLKKTRDNVPSFFPSQEVELLFILLSGPGEKRKKVMMLNEMLVDWVATARKKNVSNSGSIFHSPSTLNFMVRSFFASTKDYYNWCFSYADFNFDGGFNGFFKSLLAKRQKEDVSLYYCVF